MKITRVLVQPIEMKLTEPYSIAYARYSSAVNVFLTIETKEGITGYGCACPDFHVTGESPESTVTQMEETAVPLLVGHSALDREKILQKMRKALGNAPAVRAAVDMALYDILGKKCGMPLYILLGGYRHRIRTSVTIGILPPDDTCAEAKELKAQGFSCLKIKGGESPEADIEKVLRVRAIVGEGVHLRFDANQGYTKEEALRFCRETASAKIEMLEQPTPAEDHSLLGEVTRKTALPIMADESLLNLRDAFHIARGKIVDMVNIKLMKVGGISEALHIDSIARAASLDIMVGCMDEAGLAISAGLHYALSSSKVGYADLDGHLLLKGDPTSGAVILDKGYLYPNGNPGLGHDTPI